MREKIQVARSDLEARKAQLVEAHQRFVAENHAKPLLEPDLSHKAECAALAEQGLQAALEGAEMRGRELQRELGEVSDVLQALRVERACLDKDLGEKAAALAGAQKQAERLLEEVASDPEEATGLWAEASMAHANLGRRAQDCRTFLEGAEGKLRDTEREALRARLRDAESHALAQERAHDHALNDLQHACDRLAFNEELEPLRHESASHRTECERLKQDLEEACEYKVLAEEAAEEVRRE